MTDLSIHGYCGLYPVTRAERRQAETEAALEREDRDDTERTYCGLDEGTGPQAAEGTEEDPVTYADRWRWTIEAFWQVETLPWHMMTPEEREREEGKIRRIVDEKSRHKRDEVFTETRKELIELYSKVKGE
jgi:hypothetical protein